MAKVLKCLGAKRTLGFLHMKTASTQNIKYCTNMLNVLGPGITVNEYVIKKYKDKSAQERLQHRVHQSLEGGRGI